MKNQIGSGSLTPLAPISMQEMKLGPGSMIEQTLSPYHTGTMILIIS